jgi:hypothetical protein
MVHRSATVLLNYSSIRLYRNSNAINVSIILIFLCVF